MPEPRQHDRDEQHDHGGPRRTTRYHRRPTRHSTYRRSKQRMPALPPVAPVTMNAAKVGPRKTQTALTKITLPFGIPNGKRPTPFAESATGTVTSHVPA